MDLKKKSSRLLWVSYIKVLTLASMNMTLFRNRVFADIINWNGVGPKSNEWCPYKERAIWRCRYTHREEAM